MEDLKDRIDPSVNEAENNQPQNEEQYSLSDDRRVKVLSPGQLVAKRFIRNRLAVTGMVILLVMLGKKKKKEIMEMEKCLVVIFVEINIITKEV